MKGCLMVVFFPIVVPLIAVWWIMKGIFWLTLGWAIVDRWD